MHTLMLNYRRLVSDKQTDDVSKLIFSEPRIRHTYTYIHTYIHTYMVHTYIHIERGGQGEREEGGGGEDWLTNMGGR